MANLILDWERRSAELQKPDGLFMVSAHRGYWTCPEGYPENSLPAFKAAYEAGVDIIEVDVQRTADNQLVLCHDEHLRRVSNIKEAREDGTLPADASDKICELTLEQIKKLRLKTGEGGPNATITDTPIATLAEALEYCRHKMFLLLDRGWEIRRELYPLIAQYDAFDSCIFQMAGPLAKTQKELLALQEEFGGMPLFNWFCGGPTLDDLAERAKELDNPENGPMPSIIQPGTDCLGWLAVVDRTYDQTMAWNPEMLKHVLGKVRMMSGTYIDWGRRLGFESDAPSIWKPLLDAGYRSIQTDQPFQCLQYAHELGYR